ncbi:RNA polymerase sigma-70 factor (ECF subfamily) [Novosphingobium capsulatum]|uniref:RNA polymerase sigma-70 factor (ECF subfamily) n=1 Tax=Novosphingobium capsulatum TaxID=13688 RepID=A0ABU1ML82_9SPHN|nr:MULTISPECIES: RNA polymerase sigma factor [Novosphingobium]MBB3358153.1 RNA polymerase sigma-70 factor (ECF subfamily) [Novosphingobium sp. BK256]MBB3374514.1 RNA polymerase sigma-70 factor (ECF subfamily) [Novosphingobium sp. BK280]MBB3378926.1 RNA polymerase sigma-70 factor (ECF subfamily) [Novosphingobium sp. BK258]MBB3420620.1 RNA polymerase sigma-70 factor (ECF subfamily) [Novosphingobium sp. BK267]MBB3448258.1 RNA polymerase sigma-70 factor (ECF subfamily) [Novosphingobium sp. BK352]
MSSKRIIPPAGEAPLSGFERHRRALRAWLGRRLGNAADVDDAVQDVWLRAHERLDSGAVDNPRAYLFTAANSVVHDRARRAGVRHERAHRSLEENDHPVEWITPERVLEGKEALNVIMNRLSTMPERTRDVFVLHRFEGMAYAEIARRMGISVSSVEKHIMKALRLLLEIEE